MIRFLFWNIRGVLHAPNLKRLRKLVKMYSISLVAICEPKSHLLDMDTIRVKVGMDFVVANRWGSVWVLYQSAFSCHLIGESD